MSYNYWSAGWTKDVKWNRSPPSQGGNGGSTPPPAIINSYQVLLCNTHKELQDYEPKNSKPTIKQNKICIFTG